MKDYTWVRPWNRKRSHCIADRVTFEPGHVAFWDEEGELVVAIQNADVTDLEIDKPDPDFGRTKETR